MGSSGDNKKRTNNSDNRQRASSSDGNWSSGDSNWSSSDGSEQLDLELFEVRTHKDFLKKYKMKIGPLVPDNSVRKSEASPIHYELGA